MIEIPLHSRTGIVGVTLVDPADEALAERRWSRLDAGGYYYAICDMRRKRGGVRTGTTVLMHRWIMGLEAGDPLKIDHYNGDGLDNRRTNLRIATNAENGQNRRGPRKGSRSGVRGVVWCCFTGRWKVEQQVDGKRHFIGRYPTVEEAAIAAAEWRREHMPFAVDHA